MDSKYQMWLTFNGESEKLRFPVLPEQVTIKSGSINKSVDISGVGEVVIKQDSPALIVNFKSFFPSSYFPGVQTENITSPDVLAGRIMDWKNSDKPVHFIITGTTINMYCVIEDFTCSEDGGDVGTIHYSISLKEYREVASRKVNVDEESQTVVLPPNVYVRADNRIQPGTYTVMPGDSLWNISTSLLGSGSRYTEILSLNPDIKNIDFIQPGQVLKLSGAE